MSPLHAKQFELILCHWFANANDSMAIYVYCTGWMAQHSMDVEYFMSFFDSSTLKRALRSYARVQQFKQQLLSNYRNGLQTYQNNSSQQNPLRMLFIESFDQNWNLNSFYFSFKYFIDSFHSHRFTSLWLHFSFLNGQ